MRFFYPGTVQKCVNVVLSRKLLQNEYLFRLLTKIGFEKAENELCKVFPVSVCIIIIITNTPQVQDVVEFVATKRAAPPEELCMVAFC